MKVPYIVKKMKFKIGDRVYYNEPFVSRRSRIIVGIIVSTNERLSYADTEPGYSVLWENQSSPMTPYSESLLGLVCDPNDILKGIL